MQKHMLPAYEKTTGALGSFCRNTHFSTHVYCIRLFALVFIFKAYHPLVRRGFELLVAKFKGKLTRDLMGTENVVNVVRMIKVSPIRLTCVTEIRMC